MYMEYLIGYAKNKLNLSAENLKLYTESQDYANLVENVNSEILKKYPNKND
jgi:hypothetical protein